MEILDLRSCVSVLEKDMLVTDVKELFQRLSHRTEKVKTKENKGERNRKQESVPVECIPTAAVAAIRCQY